MSVKRLVLNKCGRYLAKPGLFFVTALLFGTTLSRQASAQTINFFSPIQLVDNDANQGSPTIIVFNSQLVMYYVNHSNNTIYVDFGLGNPQSTGIPVYSGEITDVGAAVLNGKVLIAYVATDDNTSFATSTDGVHFGPRVVPPASALGVGSQNPDPALVPGLASNGSTAYVATVGNNNHWVYISTTTDGSTFTPLQGNGHPVSSYATLSRPSLTCCFNSTWWVGFTSYGPFGFPHRSAVVGNNTHGVLPAADEWGNNNRDGNYAGISLVSYNSFLYIFGQDIASSQHLKYWYTADVRTWSGDIITTIQMRWTPSLTVSGSTLWLVYQDDANTNISYTHN